MKVIVLTNPGAGTQADEKSQLRDVLASVGVEARVELVEGEDLTRAAKDAIADGVDAVVAAGGDGTVSAVATALVGTDVPLGILPTGTLNHFAKDLNLPLELPEAARVIAAGNVRAVDVAEVNGRIFINNSSIGLYPHIVKDRDRQRERLGRGKWTAMLVAAMTVLRRHPLVDVRIATAEKSLELTTPFVFIGNNEYEMALTTLGTRKRVDAGQLSLYLTTRVGRFSVLRLALRAILGRLEQSKDFQSLTAAEVWIETQKHTLRVAVDGEVIQLVPPLHYRIRPKALRVLAPA